MLKVHHPRIDWGIAWEGGRDRLGPVDQNANSNAPWCGCFLAKLVNVIESIISRHVKPETVLSRVLCLQERASVPVSECEKEENGEPTFPTRNADGCN